MKDFIKKKLHESLLSEEKIPMNIPIPNDISEIKDVFVKNGFKLFVVGGAVRDAILGKTPKDYDLATNAKPNQVESIMKKAGYKTLPTGKAFGVINVFTDIGEYEVATFRSDQGKGRRPDSVEFTTIDNDVMRRDLTINALFYDIDSGEVIDLVGGIEDLKNGVIRTVGNPNERFSEDRLRIMRTIRFAARFGSNLEPEVDRALEKDGSLEGVSSERIRDEFLKGIKTAKSVIHFCQLLNKYKLFDWVFPGLKINREFIEEKNPIILIANILKGNNTDMIQKQLNLLTYTKEEISKIVFLLKFLEFQINQIYHFKKAQINSKIADSEIRKFAELNGLDKKIVEAFLKFQLTVTGQDMVDKGFKPGPEMGKAIRRAEIENFKKML